MEERISTAVLTAALAPDARRAEALLQAELAKSRRKIVVLDDDPTGVQTVHDVSVYTDWEEESVLRGFQEENRLFYILTNSRGFTARQTEAVHRKIAAAVAKAAEKTGKDYVLMSRSDSTLRGHYPLETAVLKEEMEKHRGIRVDGEILCPFFQEGGRFTIHNIHYVQYGAELVPAAQTEFAKDPTFGYSHSDLREYVEEKTGGAYRADQVIGISLEDLRGIRIDKIVEQLCAARDFQKIVVNATDTADVKVMAAAVYRAMAKGKTFLFRTAAALVKEMGGISPKPLLTREQMICHETGTGGVIIVGSHTEKTTRQLEELEKTEGIVSVAFNSDLVLDEEKFQAEQARVTRRIEEIIRSGKTAVAYTRRKLLTVADDTKEDALLRSVKISDAVQSLVGNLTVAPSFVIAKGGITSSDVGTKALRVKRAHVLGQIRPGIPVWQTGEESKFPHMPYVIFPGNVGQKQTLREAAEILMRK